MPDSVDYKELYLKLFRTTEQAIRLLITTQQECEELYMEHIQPTEEEFSPEGRMFCRQITGCKKGGGWSQECLTKCLDTIP